MMQPMRKFRLTKVENSGMRCSSCTPTPRDNDVTPRNPNTPGDLHNVPTSEPADSLRDKITKLARAYVEEAHSIKKEVEFYVKKCRTDIRVIYRWCQASILDLGDVIDDAMADELYFMVRGKLARSISSISVLEEAADVAEKTLTHHFGEKTQSKEAAETSTDGSVDEESYPLDAPWVGTPQSGRSVSTDSGAGTLGMSTFGASLPGEFSIGHLLSDSEATPRASDTSRSSPGPGPPRSPRPKGLVNHPRIVKDRMQHQVLHSTW